MRLSEQYRIRTTNVFYDICFKNGKPIGINDQIELANNLVVDLYRCSLLKENDHLLVVGGGIAGVTAALTAVHLGLTATIHEIGDKCFAAQLKTSTRHIHPHLYEWPNYDWDQAYLLPPGTPDPHPWLINWRVDFASNVAAHWTDQLLTRIKESRNELSLKLGQVRYQNIEDINDLICRVARINRTSYFQAVIFALGCKGELTRHCGFSGLPFWHEDNVENWLAAQINDSQKRAFVSGAGDGALQDFIRLATGKPIHLLAHSLFDSSLDGFEEWFRTFRYKVRSVDKRSCFSLLQDTVRELPISLWTKWYEILDKNIHCRLPHLVMRKRLFKNIFPLNGFLVLLLDKFSVKRWGKKCILYNSTIKRISPRAVQQPTKISVSVRGKPCRVYSTNYVIIRHGIRFYT